MDAPQDTPIVHDVRSNTASLFPVIAGIVLLGGLGIATGFVLHQQGGSAGGNTGGKQVVETGGGEVKKGKIYGLSDTKGDTAEGKLEKGGLDGEGSHKLIRPGGDDQTVYLTSSVLDLNQFVGKQVRVGGETFAAKKAGWFMDVGRVELLE